MRGQRLGHQRLTGLGWSTVEWNRGLMEEQVGGGPRFQLLSGDEKKVIESMSPSLSLSNFFDSENIG
jgi:hypothetical protein